MHRNVRVTTQPGGRLRTIASPPESGEGWGCGRDVTLNARRSDDWMVPKSLIRGFDNSRKTYNIVT